MCYAITQSFRFVQEMLRQQSLENDGSSYQCFHTFNPSNEPEFKRVVDNWSDAYLDMAEKVASRLSSGVANGTVWSPAPSAKNGTAMLTANKNVLFTDGTHAK